MTSGWGIRTIKSKKKSNGGFNTNRIRGFGEISDMHSTVAASNQFTGSMAMNSEDIRMQN